MLIRVQGGSGGIAEYLEKGIKNGRDHTRDELDQRVILDGDLAITDQIIKDMQTKTPEAERYLHVTLSFKENNVSREMLEDVVQAFKAFTMAAYEEDEYNFYAEAHLPKIKSLTDKKTGEPVERKPHIHVVIPETNLLTNKRLDPFGKVDHHKEYIDAFQEVINEKYGLASPKIHVRQEIADESNRLARTKGDIFKGASHEIKEQILRDILEKDIISTEQLAKHLNDEGWSVRVRNEGKDNAYLNIKQPEAKRGINLKDSVFQSAFLEQPTEKKHQALAPEKATYSAPDQGSYQAPKESHEKLAYWHERRAHEVRLLSRRDRERYNHLSESEKNQFLTAKREKIHGQHRTPEPAEHSDDYLEAAGKHLLNAERNRGGIKSGVRGVTHRRTLRAVGTLIQRHRGYQAEPQQQRGRSVASDTLTQRHNDVVEADNIHIDRRKMTVIQKRMDASALLISLSQSHGVIPDKYTIIIGRDGGDRITCGNHNLNVADFLTKEMQLPWQEARKVLIKEDQRQQGRSIGPAIDQDREVFRHHWQPALIKQRKRAWKDQLFQERQRRRTNYQHLRTERNAIYADSSMDRKEKAVAISVARMNKVINDMQVARLAQTERDTLNSIYPDTFTHQWQQFEARGIQTESTMKNITKTATSQTAEQDRYLAVPYEDREQAKAVGARWDREQKSWFAPKGTDLSPLSQWLPENQASKPRNQDPAVEFQAALVDAGFQMDDLPVMDGQLHRAKVDGDRGSERNGAYVGYLDERPAGMIQNWKTGLKTTWKSEGATLSPEEKVQMQAELAKKRQTREQQRTEQYETVSSQCQEKWDASHSQNIESAYLARKQVDAHGLRKDVKGQLVVPARDINGKLWTLQTISPDGDKRFEKGGKKSGCFHVVGNEKNLSQHKTLLIAEGYATAASIHQATRQPVVVAFDSGNLSAVATDLHQKMPDQQIIIMGDDDHHREQEGKPNVGREKAVEVAAKVGGKVIFPNFSPKEKREKFTDFNDLHVSRGMEPFKQSLQEALKTINQEQSMKENESQQQESTAENAYLAAKNGDIEPVAAESKTVEAAQVDTSQVFKGAYRETKEQILQGVLEKNISSSTELKSHLEESGWSVKLQNEGQKDAYLYIKQPDAKRGLNLKDEPFQASFLELPQAQKLAALNGGEQTVQMEAESPVVETKEPEPLMTVETPQTQEQLQVEQQTLSVGPTPAQVEREEMAASQAVPEEQQPEPVNTVEAPSAQHLEQKPVTPEPEPKKDAPRLEGKLLNYGIAPYHNIQENKDSYFVTIKQNDQERTIWGTDLQRALHESSLKKGDDVALTLTGKKQVEVEVERTNSKGQVIRVDKLQTHQNQWQAEKISEPQQTNEQPKAVNAKNINQYLEASRLLVTYPDLKNKGFSPQMVEKTSEGQKIREGDKLMPITDYLESKNFGRKEKIIQDLTPSYESQIKDRERVKAYQEKQKASDVNVEKAQTLNYGGEEKKQFQPLKPINFEDVTYKSNEKGHVAYYLGKTNIVTDEGQRVTVNQTSDKGVEVGLRLSMEKFGKTLDVRGTKAYKESIVMVAAREKLDISFTDSEMNKALELHRSQMERGENFIQAAEQRMVEQRQDVQLEQQRQPEQSRGPAMSR